MQTVPDFTAGEYVRVMQTTEMESLGWSGLHGRVARVIGRGEEQVCEVQFADQCVAIKSCHLARA